MTPEQLAAIRTLEQVLHNIRDTMQLKEPELIEAYERVLQDLRNYEYPL